MANIVRERNQRRMKEIAGEELAGFWPGRGTIDQVFEVSQIIEKFWKYDRNLHCVFIDFKQAFHSVWREGMMDVHREIGVEEGVTRTVNRMYQDTMTRVTKGNIITEESMTNKGVIQECPTLPYLFNIYLQKIMIEVFGEWARGVNLGGYMVGDLRYADDIVLLG